MYSAPDAFLPTNSNAIAKTNEIFENDIIFKAHLYCAAGVSSNQKRSKLCEIYKNIKRYRKNILKTYLYSAAGAFFQKKCSEHHENMRISQKTWKSYKYIAK